MPKISIVIPTKNEEKNIDLLLERLDKTCTTHGIEYEAICIDDCSEDKTVAKVTAATNRYPVSIYPKAGKPGKAYSILEGVEKANSDYILMLDADLQYPPEAIPQMLEKMEKFGVVVANRKTYKSTLIRKFASRFNALVFGRLFFGIKTDVQSGLKLFHRDIIKHLDVSKVSAWSLDIPLLYTAMELGYRIGTVDISFELRKRGQSKIRFLTTAVEIIRSALKLKLTRKSVYLLPAEKSDSMLDAGLVHRRNRFITHTTLDHSQSALVTFHGWQLFVILFIVGLVTGGLLYHTLPTVIFVVALLSAIYFLDVVFNFYLLLRSLHSPPEITTTVEELTTLSSSNLPVYSILCPLYKEAHIVPQFITALGSLDWPQNKLDVLLLLEEDDKETIEKVNELTLPSYVRVILVPDSAPKTKPKACNYGLAFARGEYTVIYDAEDIPDPQQLKKSYITFGKLPPNVICLQAKLNYYNPHHNLLTRLFTTEYSLWFDIMLPGLQSIDTAIPLGGTSNHFRTRDLLSLKGWDPFNVTEDCDLGVRLFKKGYKTAIIDSTTLEEANSQVGNWLRQRSRWLKGYLQTYFVHMRSPIELVKTQGIHAFIFQLVVGGKIAFMLINPFLWVATISYFALYSLVGPTIEAIYPAKVFYMAAFSLVAGNFMYLYNYMIGAAKRDHYALIKYVFFIPFYWLLVSIGAAIATFQLFFKPHYWEKTVHGFHLEKKPAAKPAPSPPRFAYLRGLISSNITTGGILVSAAMIANVFNFLYNAYLGRVIGFEEFGLLSLISSILNLSQIPISSYSRTITHRSAYLLGKYQEPVKKLWRYYRTKSRGPALILTGIWLVSIPFLSAYFKVGELLPFILLTPVWSIGMISAVDSGFISGNHRFTISALMTLVEVVTKFISAILLVHFGLIHYVYVSLPLATISSFVVGWLAAKSTKEEVVKLDQKSLTHFPKKFYGTTVFTKLSTLAFLNIDVLLVKHFLSATEAGQYALLSLIGSMVYFIGSLFSQFITPLVSRHSGAGKESNKTFYQLLLITALTSIVAFLGVGVFGYITTPILFGTKVYPILEFLPKYTFAMLCFILASSIVIYHQAKHNYLFPVGSLIFTISQIAAIATLHENIGSIVNAMFVVGLMYLLVITLAHLFYESIDVIVQKSTTFSRGVFSPKSTDKRPTTEGIRILIFNWRDIKHVWAGGAETYIHELAKRWVKEGHEVTLFCGNDRKNPHTEVIDGVRIVRQGGFFTVYLWAFIYYMLEFRCNFDVIIDSENGVPFFTPLFVRLPKFLLIHHVHQSVFREHLPFPFSTIAAFIEIRFMPLLYRDINIITVSDSSKKEIIKLHITKEDNINIVSPGIDDKYFIHLPKTSHPSFLYLGRLKPYKNIDVVIEAFSEINHSYPQARLTIAGEGESLEYLQQLVSSFHIGHAVTFLGKVPERVKMHLMARSWIALQPSSFEGWGMTVIEANAAGTPVIASNVNGLKDSVLNGKTGILVPLKRVSAFTQAMESLIITPTRRNTLSRQAIKWAKEFRWNNSAKIFYRIIMKELPPDPPMRGISGNLVLIANKIT